MLLNSPDVSSHTAKPTEPLAAGVVSLNTLWHQNGVRVQGLATWEHRSVLGPV